mmetsp:Transcript_9068/g.13242  ORF Transcript_9068/g.13242 Transcript_9068/m.13242 type:complete len:329 (-) Transcript_9068:256-1242(-)
MVVNDDGGGLLKTLSVENSFMRGTITTIQCVKSVGFDGLFVRLPKLLDERKLSSHAPQLAYPTTIRLSVRVVDPSLVKKNEEANTRRRPFLTVSKQFPFDGKRLLNSNNAHARSNFLQSLILPPLDTLLYRWRHCINVTKINVAVTNFADLLEINNSVNGTKTIANYRAGDIGQSCVTQFFHSKQSKDCVDIAVAPVETSQLSPSVSSAHSRTKKPDMTLNRKRKTIDEMFKRNSCDVPDIGATAQQRGTNQSFCERKNISQQSLFYSTNSQSQASRIDPNFLAELPPDIAEEICKNEGQQLLLFMDSSSPRPQAKKHNLKHYFVKKS